jgi:predicted N-formylglutamate amidohydrolase
MNEMPYSLLAADEPPPVTVYNENGRSPFLIVADRAGNSMPRALRRLGVPETESKRHIAWDIGIAAACRLVAEALDATHGAAELFAPCHRLQPDAGLGDFDPRNQRAHADTRKYRLE